MKQPILHRLLPLLVLLPLISQAGPYEAGAVVLKSGGEPEVAEVEQAPAAEQAPAPAPAAPTVAVEKSGIATRLGFGQPADDVDRIAPDQARFHPWVRLDGTKSGQAVECRLVFQAASGDIEAASATAKTDAKGTALCTLALPDGMNAWPEGEYRVEFLSGSEPVHQLRFAVGG